jgi:hypothetical protein
MSVDHVCSTRQPPYLGGAAQISLVAQRSNLGTHAIDGKPFRELPIGACHEHRISPAREQACK